MPRKTRTAILLTVALGVAGCNAGYPNGYARPNRGLDSLNQPVVQRTDYVLDLAGGANGLSPDERARLAAWFGSLGLGYGDRVFVDGDYGFGGGRDDVARVAAEHGILLSEGAPVTAGAVAPDTVRVVVSRSTATVPGCPNWHKGDWPEGPSATSSNYGCAVNSNLAAMVADPSDLVLGQTGSGTGDATTASKAIQVYRQAPPTGTKGLSDTETRGNN